MVFFTRILAYAKPPRKYLQKGFIDNVRFHVRGGAGGSGLARYGGIGGRGGDVVIVATEKMTLRDVMNKYQKKSIYANPGYDSERRGILGKPGENIEIKVPVGVTAYDSNGAIIGEVDKPGSTLIVAKGGIGGCPETGFSGQRGQRDTITLDLKLIADVALVGFPNAGKSTLLNLISNARPKIAAYPFTTMRPHLGIINYPDLRTISVADLPGLIEGAHNNIGLGHKFLKHLDRTKLLIFIVDIQGFRLSTKYHARSCLETLILLNKEMELYQPDLIDMTAILIVNKMDSPNAEKTFKAIEPALKNLACVVDDYPKEMRPENVVKFEEIFSTSLILKKEDEINLIKEKIRYYLDKQAEKELENREDPIEVKVFNKLKQELRIHSPTVV
ncbi:GTP-binding protein 10 homolog [Chelonus insularis]|uniref:GTP-binding protein 10 homolog n=1 Tax=Chelonus insularis TaxID=460826 RepID=UPI00158ED288|nr:GTP-binding protein 10 homolog [Chelonus insularis]XP_034943282.1 GTP-binding protein 10 homolog [Chelonus insularis]